VHSLMNTGHTKHPLSGLIDGQAVAPSVKCIH
jgi:hypothetical protein